MSIKQRCNTEFFHVEKHDSFVIHQPLLNVYADKKKKKKMDVCIVKGQVMRFDDGESDAEEKSRAVVNSENEERLDQLFRVDQVDERWTTWTAFFLTTMPSSMWFNTYNLELFMVQKSISNHFKLVNTSCLLAKCQCFKS